jgi:phage terminase large subunit-like protein
MALSNTATPKYYGRFRDAVVRGEIPVNKEIELEMNRIDALIKDPYYWYDDLAVEGWVRYCEDELTLTDGSPLHLLDTFLVWGEQVYCWYYFEDKSVYEPDPNGRGGRYVKRRVKKRLTRKQFLIIARGASKTVYASSHQSYNQNVDTSTTYQITTAPTMKQAEEVMSTIRTAVTVARGPLFKFLTEGSLQNTTGSRAKRQKLASTKKGIQNFMTNSLIEVRPMTIDKLQGLRCKIATVDEWLSVDIREDPIIAIEQGASKVADYLIIATSSEGTVRNGPGDTIKMELQSILNGDLYAPHVSIWWYKLDSLEEIDQPEMWRKANPNLGYTVDYNVYHEDVAKIESVPATKNDIIAKRFGIPLEGYTYFFAYEDTVRHKFVRSYHGMPCALGTDLSQGDDFCAFTFLFPLKNGTFGVKVRAYISELKMKKLPLAMNAKYQEFINEGSLIVINTTVLDMNDIYDDLDDFIIHEQYDILCHGYDPYNAKEFIAKWTQFNGPFGVEKVIQGKQTETVPLGELKIFAEQRALLFDQELMQFAMGNCITIEDNNGQRMLLKKRYDAKIDPVSAMMDAYVAYKLHKDAFD